MSLAECTSLLNRDESAPPTIVDETAVKPSGWLDDEEDTIPDPSAVQPEDWQVNNSYSFTSHIINLIKKITVIRFHIGVI